MDPREAWQLLQAQLTAARQRLDAGDRAGALEAVDAALAIDPDFLAAHSLRQKIQLGQDAAVKHSPASVTPASRARDELTSAPITPTPGRIERKLLVPQALTVPRVPAPRPVSVRRTERQPAPRHHIEHEAAPPSHIEKPPVFSPLAEEPLVPPRVEEQPRAANVALEDANLRRTTTAPQLVAELPLRPERPQTKSPKNVRSPRRRPAHRSSVFARRLAAAAVVGGVVFGASYLQDWSLGDVGRFTQAWSVADIQRALHEWSQSNSTPAASQTTADPMQRLLAASTTVPLLTTTLNGFEPVGAHQASARPQNADVERATTPTPSLPPTPAPAPARAVAAVVDEQPADVTRTPPVERAVDPAPSTIARNLDPPKDAVASAPDAAPVTPPPAASAVETNPAAATASTVRGPDDERLVRQALLHYRTAYESLDARSAQAVWPTVNEAALARAFEGLDSQTLTFTNCYITFVEQAAQAICQGSTRYVPKVGSREPRTEPRIWNFTLRRSGSDWKIESARTDR
ncbi:MAG TPA: hypothetical protein VH583_18770 [Vicinamibacterales bacterium]